MLFRSKMREMHAQISGRLTRSVKSWKINEDMILNNHAFLIEASNKEKVLSYYLFFFDKITSVYFSSVSLREYFKIYKNLGHTSIWEAIKYLKNVSKFFYLGDEKLSESLSYKEKNIIFFKKGFSNLKKKYIYIDNCNSLLDYFNRF